VRRVAALALLATLLLAGCGHTNRPEAVVERWLNALNQGAAGRPGMYAQKSESDLVVPRWWSCDPGVLDVVEVGKGDASRVRLGKLSEFLAFVPYRITYASDAPTRCMPHALPTDPVLDVAILGRTDSGSWRVNSLTSSSQTAGNLRVPSEGGPQVASSSAVIWVVGLLVGFVLCGLVAILMRAMPKPAPVSSEPIDPSEARGL
jgi:hypothetical protein